MCHHDFYETGKEFAFGQNKTFGCLTLCNSSFQPSGFFLSWNGLVLKQLFSIWREILTECWKKYFVIDVIIFLFCFHVIFIQGKKKVLCNLSTGLEITMPFIWNQLKRNRVSPNQFFPLLSKLPFSNHILYIVFHKTSLHLFEYWWNTICIFLLWKLSLFHGRELTNE